MLRNIIQLLGIALFFILIGYVLTYPYELKYRGSDKVIIFEDSYDATSLDELTNRKEFNGKVLYIKIYEPFDTEIKPYSVKELEAFKNQLDALKETPESEEYKLLAMKMEGQFVKTVSLEEQINALAILSEKYKNTNLALVCIADSDNDSQSKSDDLRKWKMALKKHKISGYHLIMNRKLVDKVRQKLIETTNNAYLPFYLIADKQGTIINYQAPYPQDTAVLYPLINQFLNN